MNEYSLLRRVAGNGQTVGTLKKKPFQEMYVKVIAYRQ